MNYIECTISTLLSYLSYPGKLLKRFFWIPGIAIFAISCNTPETMNLDSLEKEVRIAFDSVAGDFALAFLNVSDSTDKLLINEDLNFHAASTMKTPVMIEIFKQANQGKFSLEDSILIRNEFKSIVDSSLYSMDLNRDSGDSLYQMIGQKRTLRELVIDMIIHSSNLATNLVIEMVDAKNVTQTMRELGATDIEVLRGVEDMKAFDAGLVNTTTAYDLMKIYEALARKQAVNAAMDEQMIGILYDQQHNDIIPARLPPIVRVAHKTGWITGVRHDSGIVYLPDDRVYVLVLLSKDVVNMDEAVEMMAGVSERIYQYMVTTKEQ